MANAYMASSNSSLLKVAVVTFMKIMVLSWMYVLNYTLKFSQDAVYWPCCNSKSISASCHYGPFFLVNYVCGCSFIQYVKLTYPMFVQVVCDATCDV
jgi:hypothetical protein